MKVCPFCDRPLNGLGRFCYGCGRYTYTHEAPEPEKPPPADTRSEREIRMAIRGALSLWGFRVLDLEQGYRRDGSTRVEKGLPDLLIMGEGRMEWVEVKSAKGKLTPEQEAFREYCNRNGIPHHVWRSETEAIEWATEARETAA